MKFKKILALSLSLAITAGMFTLPVKAASNLLAFPGAEGGGKYTTGARGKSTREVYHVTNLNDSGSGSLRDAVSKEGRIIVFDVSGIITLKSKLKLSKGNLTILGQTSPGDGITISGYDVEIGADNIIMRHLRIRPTDSQNGEPDGLGGRWIDNIIIDHCSVSWGVDELLTIYSGSLEDGKESENKSPKEQSKNVTVQYCLSAESLRMSNHFKGAHGYGGIIGGTNATYHHNLFAHHDSRNPRMDRNLKSTDMVNNVIYNWGNNVTYGAEPYSYNKWARYSTPEYVSNVNMRNNYYKAGPSTKSSIRSKIFEATNDGTVKYNGELLKSNFYINGNYVYGDAAATANNTATESNVMNQDKLNLLSAPISMGEYEIPVQTAEQALEDVLANVGATLPKRDSIDSRIVADVKNGTGRIINGIDEVGGFVDFESEKRTFEIPSDWKSANGMGSSAKETDIVSSGEWAGYTWIEAYVNDWTAEQSAPTNADITVTSPAVADISKSIDKTGGKGFWATTTENVPLTYYATATAKGDTTVTKIELYDGTMLLDTVTGSVINKNVFLEAGTHYLTCKAYNNKEEVTTSPTSIVYVTKDDNSIGDSTIAEIGESAFPGKNNVWVKNDVTYIGGSGLINGKSDSFSYWKHPVTGDFEFSAKIESIPKYENGALCGIMFRESLDADSRMIMISDGWKKYGENIMVPQRLKKGGNVSLGWMKDSSGEDVENNGDYNTTDESLNLALPKYMKIARSGDTLTLSVSNDGKTWTNNKRQPLSFDITGWSKDAYIGLAVDSINGSANDGNPMLAWYTIGGFSDIKMSGVTPYNVTFETNGGQITSGGFETYSYGDSKTLPQITKSGMYFGGWYDNAELEGDALTDMPKTAAGDLTYYAQWLEAAPTPTPTPEPVEATIWNASDADIGKKAGDELMDGLTLVSDNTSDSGGYVTHTSNGSINGDEVSGSALKFVAPADGTFTVTFKDIGGGNPKELVIYDVEAGTNLASYTTIQNVKETKTLETAVKAGKTYYIAGFGTKARYSAASYTPSEAGVEPPVPTQTVAPTASPVPTATPTVKPTLTPIPTVAPTAAPDNCFTFDKETGTITGYNGTYTDLVIPSEINGVAVKAIGDSAFASATFETVTIPDSVETLGSYVFRECSNLTDIIIGSGLKTIADTSFIAANGLESINVSENNTTFCSDDGILLSKDKTVLYRYPVCKLKNSYTVTAKTMAPYAMYACNNLDNIILSDSVTTIGAHSIAAISNIGSLNIGKNVTSIAHGAIYNCPDLRTITIDDENPNYKDVDGVLFTKDGSVLLAYPPNKDGESYDINVSVVGAYAMSYSDNSSNLKTVNITADTIEKYAFRNTTAEEIVVKDGIKTIESYAFSSSNLKKIYIADSVTTISNPPTTNTVFNTATTIYCFTDSVVEKYAKDFSLTYENITSLPGGEVTPTVAPTVIPQETGTPSTPVPSQAPLEIKVEYDKEANKVIITSSAEETGTLIFACYDNDGNLVAVDIADNILINAGNTEIKADEEFAAKEGNVKVYLWKSISGENAMEPLIK